jgi:hypothetical protein
MTQELYHYSNIRKLLTLGFSDDELRALCFDVPGLRPVYEDLAANTGKSEIVAKLLEHAEKTLQIDTLLALARELNPARYKEHQPYYLADSTSALQEQVAKLARRLSAGENDPQLIMKIADAKIYAQKRRYSLQSEYYLGLIRMLQAAGMSEESLRLLLPVLASSGAPVDGPDK